MASVSNILPLDAGRNLGGWAFSIDTFNISVVANTLAGVAFDGLLHVPIFRSAPTNSAPITEGDCLEYQAIVMPGNMYHFAIHPASDTAFYVPLWVGQANIYRNSTVSVTYDGADFLTEATLFGDIEIDGLENDVDVEVPRITFEGVRLANRAPYFTPGYWEFPTNIGGNLGSFGFTLTDIGIAPTQNPEEVALGFGAMINLVNVSDSINITVGGGFQLIGELNQEGGRQVWDYKKLKVTDAEIKTEWAGVSKIEGSLSFYEDNAQFGKGFRGMVSVRFAGLGANGNNALGLDAVAQFGAKTQPGSEETFKYFFIDAMAHLNPGIPIGPAIKIRGFGGGAYYHMTPQQQGSYVNLPTGPTHGASLPTLGVSLSGIQYVPDVTKGLGLKATVALATTKEEVFNANATFEILFAATGGISMIRFQGNARFMESLDFGAAPTYATSGQPNNGAAVCAYLDMQYAFQSQTLDANMAVYMNVAGGLVKGAKDDYGLLGDAVLHFGPDTWYINIGTPDNRNGLKIDIPGIGNLYTFESYLDVGNKAPAMPSLPPHVASITGAGNFMANENLRASGSGFAFGARSVINTGNLTFLVFYASFMSDTGFDLMLQDYGDAVCSQSGSQIGINGWYASGQAWTFMAGEIGIKVRVFGQNKEYKILNIGAGAALQMKLPNPFWAQGTVGGHYNILGGLVKGKCNFNVTLGENCQIAGAGDPSETLEVILHVAPGDGAQQAPINTQPSASFNLPLDEIFPLADANGNVSEYTAELEYAKLTHLGANSPVYGTVKPSFDNYSLHFVPFNMLPPNDSFSFEVKVRIIKDGQPLSTETKTAAFSTGPALSVIPESNVNASYPINGQYNFYKDEWAEQQGYIMLKVGQPELFYNIPDGYRQKVRISSQNGSSRLLPLEYAAVDKKITFPLPGALLQNETIYKLEIVNIPQAGGDGQSTPWQTAPTGRVDVNGIFTPPLAVAPSAASVAAATSQLFSDALADDAPGGNTAPVHVLYKLYFRTSAYNTFMEKLEAIELNHDFVPGPATGIRTRPLISEPFDKFEIGKDADTEALIEGQALISNTSWYQNVIYPTLYSHFPGTVSLDNYLVHLEVTQRPAELGIPPEKGVGIIQDFPEEGIEILPALYHLNAVPAAGSASQVILNNCPGLIATDYREFQSTLTNALNTLFFPGYEDDPIGVLEDEIWNFLPDWAQSLCYPGAPFPGPTNGVYPVQFKYRLPGLSTITTIHTINLIKD
ncbi:MAG: hypothetical protein H6564_15555 [Lewinellaceae bacterium]|nr:hypothetical protein [Lewinellaceae bacterium]